MPRSSAGRRPARAGSRPAPPASARRSAPGERRRGRPTRRSGSSLPPASDANTPASEGGELTHPKNAGCPFPIANGSTSPAIVPASAPSALGPSGSGSASSSARRSSGNGCQTGRSGSSARWSATASTSSWPARRNSSRSPVPSERGIRELAVQLLDLTIGPGIMIGILRARVHTSRSRWTRPGSLITGASGGIGAELAIPAGRERGRGRGSLRHQPRFGSAGGGSDYRRRRARRDLCCRFARPPGTRAADRSGRGRAGRGRHPLRQRRPQPPGDLPGGRRRCLRRDDRRQPARSLSARPPRAARNGRARIRPGAVRVVDCGIYGRDHRSPLRGPRKQACTASRTSSRRGSPPVASP